MKTGKPAEIGIDPARLERVAAAIRHDVASNRYDGVVYAVARGGVVAVHEAIGFADRATSRAARTDDIFAIMSITKTMTTAAVLSRVERGELMLTTKIADVIPEFAVKGKQRISVAYADSHCRDVGDSCAPAGVVRQPRGFRSGSMPAAPRYRSRQRRQLQCAYRARGAGGSGAET